MPFLPSLLEYTPQNLEAKLQLIINNLDEFKSVQKSNDDKIYLHLDFVLDDFASTKKVQPGNSPKIVFELISKYFKDQKIVCNCHFMGTKKDIDDVLEFFRSFDFNPYWEYILFFGEDFVSESQRLLATSNIEIGTWYDLDQHDFETKFNTKQNLLMTVLAGKSGQKLTTQNRLSCLKIIQNNSNINFTIDGGWSVSDLLIELDIAQKNKLNIISYSSFWSEIKYLISNKSKQN